MLNQNIRARQRRLQQRNPIRRSHAQRTGMDRRYHCKVHPYNRMLRRERFLLPMRPAN